MLLNKPTMETLVTLPKPLAHLFCYLINVIYVGAAHHRDVAHHDNHRNIKCKFYYLHN